jgi:protein-L-isoaspartate(D-aspartate) O-methyltransferase
MTGTNELSGPNEQKPVFQEQTEARRHMVDSQIVARGIRDQRLIDALLKVPRHRFVPENMRKMSYEDHPLTIGLGQTISQPYIVAYMTEALQLTGTENTLEIGTGSGYQTALLAELSDRVHTIERLDGLQQGARLILDELGYDNITYHQGDGTNGVPQHAPYDAIIVTAGAPDLPRPLVEQMAEGARLVIPAGGKTSQELKLVQKRGGGLTTSSLGGCRFVDLIGEYGWQK